ncbi:ATP-binding protein [Nonomuraea sp. NPDC050556]|uniref:ATP-binding protein n=1 Tax=Nonomuraea sp. NPDC050556 TaxID=3364369 RepID=UPI0037BD6AF6
MSRPLLEREGELATLADAAREAGAGRGCLALVYGEAGIGKSSLVEALRQSLPGDIRVLVGYCDDLATPRALGPIRDLIGSTGPELARAVRQGADRDRVLAALHAELSQTATVLVVEDVHWADDATLDVLRYLVRRVASLPAVLVLTYRDEAVSREHPLQHLLGYASGAPRLHRLPLRPLSRHAVRQLSAGTMVDAGELHAATSGNPFFVSEVLSYGEGGGVPPTVVDAVLSRTHLLGGAVTDALEQLAVVPTAVERWLADALLPDGLSVLAPAERRGLIGVSAARVAFRHELTRRAIADSLPGARRVELNKRVLAALRASPGRDLAQLVHHAAEAGDLAAIDHFAPEAAREASRAGAHREAAAHYRLALTRQSTPELLEGYAIECYTLGDASAAVTAQAAAVELRRKLDDQVALGAGLRWLSRINWWAGLRRPAETAAREAIQVLAGAGDRRLLALAYSNQAQLDALAHRNHEAIEYGERAVALSREVGDRATLSHALNNVALARWHLGQAAGRATLEDSLRVALAAGEDEHACRAYCNLVWELLNELDVGEARRYVTEGIDLAEGSEHLGFLGYLYVERALVGFASGHWDEAVDDAEVKLDRQLQVTRCAALTVLGRIRVRRGLPGGDELLATALPIAESIEEIDRVGMIATGRAEAAWLRGDLVAAVRHASPVYAWACRVGHTRLRAELGYWLNRSGSPVDIGLPHPFAEKWPAAASAWHTLGYPYEEASALADSNEPDHMLTALGILDGLGAEPLARIVRARLRGHGVSRIPRGPAASTRRNPAGLTARQVDVARLLSQGLTNAEIAERLVLSVRTVDNHVAAVLAKLGAATRRDLLGFDL